MFKKAALIAAAATTGLIALPSAAQAQYGYGYDSGRYQNQQVQYDRYGRAYSYDRYGRAVYAGNNTYNRGGYYGGNNGYYGRSQNNGYYGNSHYNGQRCSSGTTGTIVGGVAGALLGREISRSGTRYGYSRGGSGTTGAIIGGAVGALAGRAIQKSGNRC